MGRFVNMVPGFFGDYWITGENGVARLSGGSEHWNWSNRVRTRYLTEQWSLLKTLRF